VTELTPSELREYISKVLQSQRPSFVDTHVNIDASEADEFVDIPFTKLDQVFKGRVRDPDNKVEFVDPTELWTLKAKRPSGYVRSRVDSIPLTRYGRISYLTPDGLPDMTQFNSADSAAFLTWGFEQGHVGGHDNISFQIRADAGADTNRVLIVSFVTGAPAGVANLSFEVTSLITNPVTDRHLYWIKLNRNSAEWFVDGDPVAIQIFTSNSAANTLGLITAENTPPYVVFAAPYREMMSNFRWTMTGPTDVDMDPTFDPRWLYWVEGDPLPPRTYRLYDWQADTLMTSGTYDTGVSHKSHPIPIHGYDGKTLLFRADTDSVTDGLRIEVYTQEGNWRLYDSVTTSANSLESYVISGDFPLARIGYEPSADGASITDAEAHLR